MNRGVLIEYIALYGVVALMIFVPMKQIVVGMVLTFLGAFFPSDFTNKLTGNGKITFKGVEVSLAGSLRLGVIVAGIVVLIGVAIQTSINVAKTTAGINSDSLTPETIRVAITTIAVSVKDESVRKAAFTRDRIRRNPHLYYVILTTACDGYSSSPIPGDLHLPPDTCRFVQSSITELMRSNAERWLDSATEHP